MKALVLVAGSLACAAMACASPLAEVAVPTPNLPPGVTCDWAKVIKVTDGDTIRVDLAGGPANQSIRYIGIDTPETVHPTLGVQPFGKEASARNVELVRSKAVCLERDVSERDRYDRLLRYVWLADGRMVNEVLVSEGLAVVDTFPPDVKYVDRFVAAQRIAREDALGLWAE